MTQPPRTEGDRLTHLLWEVSTRTTLLGEASLAESPLTLAGVGILNRVVERPGITIAEIAREAPVSQQAVSQVVARLEKLGYVERRLASGRSIGLYATAAGVQGRDHGLVLEDGLEARLQEALGHDRYERLRALLDEARPIVTDLQAER